MVDESVYTSKTTLHQRLAPVVELRVEGAENKYSQPSYLNLSGTSQEEEEGRQSKEETDSGQCK